MSFFSTASEPQTVENELLPEGGYRLYVNSLKRVFKADGSGANWFEAEFAVLPYAGTGDNPFEGRKAWHNFTFDNPNAMAVQIGRRQLADFLWACAGRDVVINDPLDIERGGIGKEIYAYIGTRVDKRDNKLRQDFKMFYGLKGGKRSDPKASLPMPPESAMGSLPSPTAMGAKMGSNYDDVPF